MHTLLACQDFASVISNRLDEKDAASQTFQDSKDTGHARVLPTDG